MCKVENEIWWCKEQLTRVQNGCKRERENEECNVGMTEDEEENSAVAECS